MGRPVFVEDSVTQVGNSNHPPLHSTRVAGSIYLSLPTDLFPLNRNTPIKNSSRTTSTERLLENHMRQAEPLPRVWMAPRGSAGFSLGIK